MQIVCLQVDNFLTRTNFELQKLKDRACTLENTLVIPQNRKFYKIVLEIKDDPMIMLRNRVIFRMRLMNKVNTRFKTKGQGLYFGEHLRTGSVFQYTPNTKYKMSLSIFHAFVGVRFFGFEPRSFIV